MLFKQNNKYHKLNNNQSCQVTKFGLPGLVIKIL
jgi:hypothetical protein